MNSYEEKQERRQERYADLAERRGNEADALQKQASRMAEAIPFGQPILVGHHSERRDRNYRGRIHGKFVAACEAQGKADYYEQKAASVGKGGISSDDPDAVAKLQAQLAKCEELQRRMVAANKLVRKKDRAGLLAAGFTEAQVEKLFTPDFCGRLGFPDYATSNNNANIRRIRERIERLSNPDPGREPIEGTGFTISDDVAENRVLVVFDCIPPEETRQRFKAGGFKWSRDRGAWCRMRSNGAWYAAQYALRVGECAPREEGQP